MSNPEHLERRFLWLSLGFLLFGLLAGLAGRGGASVSLLTTSAILVLGARIVPLRTHLGAQVRGEIDAFRRFVSTTTRDELEMLDLARPEAFENLLPYAVAVRAEDEWATLLGADYDAESPHVWLDVGGDPVAAIGELLARVSRTAAGVSVDGDPDGARYRGRYSGGVIR